MGVFDTTIFEAVALLSSTRRHDSAPSIRLIACTRSPLMGRLPSIQEFMSDHTLSQLWLSSMAFGIFAPQVCARRNEVGLADGKRVGRLLGKGVGTGDGKDVGLQEGDAVGDDGDAVFVGDGLG